MICWRSSRGVLHLSAACARSSAVPEYVTREEFEESGRCKRCLHSFWPKGWKYEQGAAEVPAPVS